MSKFDWSELSLREGRSGFASGCSLLPSGVTHLSRRKRHQEGTTGEKQILSSAFDGGQWNAALKAWKHRTWDYTKLRCILYCHSFFRKFENWDFLLSPGQISKVKVA